jgi:protein pelota
MKIIKKVIDWKKKIFLVRMNLDQNTDDIWNVYNLLNTGDFITGTCHRKIQKETNSLVKIEKKIITCTLKIKTFQYDAENDSLRVNGVNARENKWIGLGMTQAMDIHPPRQIMIVKRDFDSIHVMRLNQMIQEEDQGHLIAITMEEGIAHIFIVTQHKTMLKQKVEKTVAKSTKFNASKKSSQKNKFFELVVQALEKEFTGENGYLFAKVKCCVIGSPGFVRENFYNYLKEISDKKQSSFIKDLISMTIIEHCSTGFKHSLNELLGS